MDLKPPCSSKDAIYFDFHNLSLILDFLENSNKNLLSEISDIKEKIKFIPDILNDIKEIKLNQDMHRNKIESSEEAISNHQIKILNLETSQNEQNDVI